jgi:hypothetical protein
MKQFLKYSLLISAFSTSVMPAFSQNEGDYRTSASGSWSDIGIWEIYDGTTWRGSEVSPQSTDGMITILAENHVSLTSHLDFDQLNIEGSLTVCDGTVMTLEGDIMVNGILTIDGILFCGSNNVHGSGAFFLNPEATLQIGSAEGITASGSKGNIQVYNRLFSRSANYVYSGNEAQVTGNGLPAPMLDGILTLDNRQGCSLSRNIVISNQLILAEGVFCLNGNTLTVGSDNLISRTEGSVGLCGGMIQGSISPLLINAN